MADNCGECNRKVAKSAKALRCDYCRSWNHTSCAGLTDDDFVFMKERKPFGFRWFCRDCSGSADDVLRESKIVSLLEEKLALGISATVEKFTEKLEALESKLSEAGNPSQLSESQSRTFSDILKKSLEGSTGATRAEGVEVRDHGKTKTVRNQQVLVVKPVGESRPDKKLMENITKNLENALETIPVESCRKTQNGGLVMKFPTEDLKGQASAIISSCLGTDSSYSVSEPKKILPKMTVVGIPNYVPDDNIVASIAKKNADIERLVGTGCTLALIFTKTRGETKTAVLKMSPEIRASVVAQGGYVFVGLSRCRAYDRFWAAQCYHCQSFGHSAENCPGRNDPPRCQFCAGTHRSKDCSNRTLKKCANCSSLGGSGSVDHYASSLECPIMLSQRQRVIENTNFSISKN